MCFLKWNQLKCLDVGFLSSIRIMSIHGTEGQTAFFVTKDDDFFSFGVNQGGWFGIGSFTPTSSSTPVKVESLCQKNISSVSSGSDHHVVALSTDGQVYSWGLNPNGELGRTEGWAALAHTVSGDLEGKKIVQVACGANHTLALSSQGEVFSWGHNAHGQLGCNTNYNQWTPIKVSALSEIVAVSCGELFSVALNHVGEIFTWGCNGEGQLGLGNPQSSVLLPTKINLPQAQITKIICGLNHTLAYSNEGVLYSWGANNYGQLGNGTNTNVSTPNRALLQFENEGIIDDIAARESVVVPRKTEFLSVNDVFRCYSNPSITHKPIKRQFYEMEESTTTKISLKTSFESWKEHQDVSVHDSNTDTVGIIEYTDFTVEKRHVQVISSVLSQEIDIQFWGNIMNLLLNQTMKNGISPTINHFGEKVHACISIWTNLTPKKSRRFSSIVEAVRKIDMPTAEKLEEKSFEWSTLT